MTTDPTAREEAERVDWTYRRRILASVGAQEEHDGFLTYREALLTALAATLEEDDAEQCLGSLYAQPGKVSDAQLIDAGHRLTKLRIGKPRRQGNEVIYPLSVSLDGLVTEESIREGQRRLRETGWTAEEFAEGLRQAVQVVAVGDSDDPQRSGDPSVGLDAMRWTPEEDT